ncbi:hypothetical protein N8993_13520 [Pseudomonadales bacterium]|nr:hypothetical protein [Pseudomonadales bacterium]
MNLCSGINVNAGIYLLFLSILFVPLIGNAEETQEDIVKRQDINNCELEIKQLCDFKPVEIDKEQRCLAQNIDNLSSKCQALVTGHLDRKRPVTLPSLFVKKAAE